MTNSQLNDQVLLDLDVAEGHLMVMRRAASQLYGKDSPLATRLDAVLTHVTGARHGHAKLYHKMTDDAFNQAVEGSQNILKTALAAFETKGEFGPTHKAE